MISNSRLCIAHIRTARRPAFTMVELLIVVAIIGILASATLFSMFGLLEEGKIARTKSQITRIDSLVMERWESYRTRAVPIKFRAPSTTTLNPQTVARIRLAAIRELMRMEMPERISDVQDDPIVTPTNYAELQVGLSIPALTRSYRRKIAATSGTWSTSYQGAECLYLILESMSDGDGTGRSFFGPGEFGDKDNDGRFELWDGWGNPIEFLRWAPGFASDRQRQDGDSAPDPFDPMKVDARWSPSTKASNQKPYLLIPLVFSAGPDGFYDIATDASPPLRYGTTSVRNDPFHTLTGGNPLGTEMDANGDGTMSYFDNLHNHLIEVK